MGKTNQPQQSQIELSASCACMDHHNEVRAGWYHGKVTFQRSLSPKLKAHRGEHET
jgi:hypothetical protein